MLLQKSLRDGRGEPSQLKQRIAEVAAEITEELRRREMEAKKPKRGRPRKKPAEEPPPDTPKCLPFAVAPDGWSASDSAAGFKALGHFASEVCNKHMGYGYEELYQWLSAAAATFEAGDIDAGSFYAMGAIKQMHFATTNIHKAWAELGLKAFGDRMKHGNRYDEDGNLKNRHQRE